MTLRKKNDRERYIGECSANDRKHCRYTSHHKTKYRFLHTYQQVTNESYYPLQECNQRDGNRIRYHHIIHFLPYLIEVGITHWYEVRYCSFHAPPVYQNEV